MITVLAGENSFEIDEALRAISKGFDGDIEKIDGETVELSRLPDLLMGGTLFADHRLVIIKHLSLNPPVWEKLPDWLARVPDEIHVVLREAKLDKRTLVYKALKDGAVIKELTNWTERDRPLAEAWLMKQAQALGVRLDKKAAHHLLERVGLDQWQLAGALEKLALLDSVTPETVDATIEANPSENVFQLFELALDGQTQKIRAVLATLELTEDPYKLFALLSSQVLQLAAVIAAGPDDSPAKDFAIHPYVASKLSRHSRKIGRRGIAQLLDIFARTDADLKTSRGEPWLLIEKALVQAATLQPAS